jgi:hypothetical protein
MIPDDPTGFHPEISEEEYHSHPSSLSVSGAKTLLKSPALFRWEQENKPRKAVWDFGHGAHQLVLGQGDPIRVIDADDWRTKAAKDEREAARAANEIPLLSNEYTRVIQMADALSSHQRAMELLSAGTPEISAFAIDEATGVMRRCRFDWFGSTLVDYKSAVSAHPDAFAAAAARFGYHQQDAWYSDVAQDLGHQFYGFDFIVQEKEPPFFVNVVRLDSDSRRRGRELNELALQRFRDCVAADIWPVYGPTDETQTIRLPKWAFYDNEAVQQ